MVSRISQRKPLLGRMVVPLLISVSCLPQALSQQGKEKGRSEPEQGEAIELRSDLVSFTVSVVSANGQSLTDLKTGDFTVLENGERQPISYFATVDAPVDIVLVIDSSGSMRSDLEIVKRAAIGFIDRMRPQDRVAIVGFSRDVELLSDLTKDRKKAREAVKRINPGSATSFYDALYVIADDLLKNVQGRKAMIILSDGVDSLSFYDYQQASGLLERSGVSVHFIEIDTEAFTLDGLRRGRFTLSPQQLERYREAYRPKDLPVRYRNPLFFTDEEIVEIARGLYKIARQELAQLAHHTGGKVYPLKQYSDLNDIYAKIAAELGTLYSIGYYPINQRHDGAWRSIRVEVTVPQAQVLARSGYWAPAK